MRKDPRLSALPVVLLTADRHATTQAVALGADHGLRKPVQLVDLIATVSKYYQDR
jgi:CheY-like chemotaxis protein